MYLPRILRTVSLAALGCAWAFTGVWAQDPPTTAPPSDEASASATSFNQRLTLLQKLLQNPEATGFAAAANAPNAMRPGIAGQQDPAVRPANPGSPANPGNEVQDDLERIKKRLDVVKPLLMKSNAAQGQAGGAPGDPESAGAGATNSGSAGSGNEPPGSTNSFPIANLGSEPVSDLQTDPQNIKNRSASDPASQMEQITAGIAVLNEAVDLFELANTAFEVGELTMALKTYESPDLKLTDPQDLNWRDYFVASCYRAQGKLAEAEGLYRIVVNANKNSLAGESANWWINHIKVKRGLLDAMQKLETELSRYESPSDANNR